MSSRRNRRNSSNDGSQASIHRWTVQGLQMQNARKRVNGIVSINMDDGWSNDKSEFAKIFYKLEKSFRGKHFAIAWNRFSWYNVKYGWKRGDGEEVFDPEVICVICNKYYSTNETVMVKGSVKFVKPSKLLSKPSQINAINGHETSDTHRIANGTMSSPQDLTLHTIVYFEGFFNVAATTHPFFVYLMKIFGVQMGNKLNSVSSAKKITIVVGSLIKSAVIFACKQSDWAVFGSDGVDIKQGKDQWYIWVRVVCGSEPIQLFFGVRWELRKTSKYLFNVFMDAIEGNDILYGYDTKKRNEYHIVGKYNKSIKDKPRWRENELKIFKTPTYTDVIKKINAVSKGALELGKNVLQKTTAHISDGSNNEYSDGEGLNGLLMKTQEKMLGVVIMDRIHCCNHEWDLFEDIVSNSSLDIIGLIDIIDRSIAFAELVDVNEIFVEVCIVWDVIMYVINKKYKNRWTAHLARALMQFIQMIDAYIATLIITIDKIKHKNNQKDIKRRDQWIQLLMDLGERYWDFMILQPVIQKSGELCTKLQSWTTTCIDAANIIDTFVNELKAITPHDTPQTIEQRFRRGRIVDALAKKNIADLEKLADDLLELNLISWDQEMQIDIQYLSFIGKAKELADEYITGIENFKSYVRWCKYRTMLCMGEWMIFDMNDGESIKTYLKNYKEQLYITVDKFKLRMNMNQLFLQYCRFAINNIQIYGNDISQYNYLTVVKAHLNDKKWCVANHDLKLSFTGILNEATSNSMAETLGHDSNVITPPHAKSRGILLQDSLLQIRTNGPEFDRSVNLIGLGMDFWYRMGCAGSVSGTSFDSCLESVERYNTYGDDEQKNDDEKKNDDDEKNDSSYARRLKSKKARQDILDGIYKPFIQYMKKQLGIEKK